MISPAPEGRQAHVLVVEDNAFVRDALRILLESAGHRLSITSSVAETLALAPRDPPDLTLLDLTLPDGDGLLLAAPLAAAGCRTVVVLTGHDDDATRERCLSAGCADVLVKPVAARELLVRCTRWLASS